jgi:hypothetical protein
MTELLLDVVGMGLLLTGLWWLSPALSLIVGGIAALFLAQALAPIDEGSKAD